MSSLKSLVLSVLLTSINAKYLVSYNASAGDAVSNLGLVNLGGWGRADWPSGQAQNSSLYFKTATDPDGVPAAHVHKSACECQTISWTVATTRHYTVAWKYTLWPLEASRQGSNASWAAFTRAEYHMLKGAGEIALDTTYYIGYKVRFDAVDYQTFVWQWKNYDSDSVGVDNIPAVLTFGKDASDANYHTM